MLTSASLGAGIYHHLEPELNINPLELYFFFPTPMASRGFCHGSSPLLFPFEWLLGVMMTCLETLWHICGDSTSLKCLDPPALHRPHGSSIAQEPYLCCHLRNLKRVLVAPSPQHWREAKLLARHFQRVSRGSKRKKQTLRKNVLFILGIKLHWQLSPLQ